MNARYLFCWRKSLIRFLFRSLSEINFNKRIWMQDTLYKAKSYLSSGQGKKAYQEAKAAMRQMPRSPDPHNIAGMALSSLGRHTEAARSFFKALQIAPDFVNARRNLAQALILAGSTDKARQVLKRLLKEHVEDQDGWYLLGQCELNAGQLDEAEKAASEAIAIAPNATRNRNLRALIRERLGDLNGSIEDYDMALGLDPNNVETLVSMSMPLARQLRATEALGVVEQAVALAPGHLGAKQRLGMHLVEAGRKHEATKTFQSVLQLEPENGLAIEQLSLLQSTEANAELKLTATRALKSAERKSENRAALLFSLAHMAKQAKDLNEEIRALANANGEMKRIMPYDFRANEDRESRILSKFPEVLRTTAASTEDRRPIYVVGMPRSGTTLAEAILGAHPNVQPLGERVTAAVLLRDTLENDLPFDEAAVEKFREHDAASLPALDASTKAYVDKMPENYRLTGFLKQVYPDCRIINMVRDPRDTALSMWRGRFSGTALNYTYDLKAMAARFNMYARMMRHWHSILPGQILDLRYEAVVKDLPTASKTIATFCNLDWVEEMTAPHEAAGQVLTLSASQVRQPVHGKSVGGWRPYADMLQPFIADLDRELWGDRLDEGDGTA